MNIPERFQFVQVVKNKHKRCAFVDTRNEKLYVFDVGGLMEYNSTEIRECFDSLLDQSGFILDPNKLFNK